MSGHSKWSTIKRKKAKVDAERGKKFTKLIKEITVAAREGGDPNGNTRLRSAVQAAKAENMPAKNIENAIKKGTGELPGVTYEELTFEGYGPQGIAILVEVVTDNKNRSLPEMRNLFAKYNGNLGETGCVNWMFASKGLVLMDKGIISEDDLMALVLDVGVDDISADEDSYELLMAPDKLEAVKKVLEDNKLATTSAELAKIPQNTIKLSGANAAKVLQLMEALEDHDDAQHVYSNFDIDAEEMEKVSG